MSQKLWVEHKTTAHTFGPTKVSIDGCSDVDDILNRLYEIPLLSIPPNTPITLYKSDGTTEIDVGDSPTSLVDGNSRRTPLVVKNVEITENSSSPSKVALVLRSNIASEDKESIVKDILELQAKEQLIEAKEREVLDKVSLYEALKEKTQRIEAERDFLKGTLDARHIFEIYESRFPKPNPKGPKPTRAERWKRHLELNRNIQEKLEGCNQSDKKILWQDKAVEIYDELCRNIHQKTIEIGNGRYILMIEKSLPKTSSCFVKVLAEELYGDNVVVQEETFDGVTSEMKAS